MGFSEFQRLNKKLSSRLLGLDINYEEEEDDIIDEEEDEEDIGVSDQGSEQDPFLRAKARWQGGLRKVLLLNRFLSAVKLSEARSSWLEIFMRKGCYFVSSRVFNCPFETIFVRASLGRDLLTSSYPIYNLCFSGMPILSLQALSSHMVESLPWERFLKQDRVKDIKNTNLKRFLHGAVNSCRLFFKALVSYPFEVAFTRKIILGQSIFESFLNLSPASWNGLTSHLVQEIVERGVAFGYENAFFSQSSEENDSVFSWILYMGLRFVISVPFIVIRENILISNPEGLYPQNRPYLHSARQIYNKNNQGGWGNYFTGIGAMSLLLPPMFGMFVSSQVIVHKLLGKTKREIFEEQVERVREILTLKQPIPVTVDSREHLETIVRMACKTGRVLVLLLVNNSQESVRATQVSQEFAKRLPEYTILLGDTNRLPFLKNLVRDARIPFFIPIVDGSIELKQVAIFESHDIPRTFETLKAILQNV